MSNNKQIMKLYTEEEILSLLKIHLADEDQADSFVSLLTPIELPSDEEITNKALEIGYTNNLFTLGAKWMRDKIQEKHIGDVNKMIGGNQ
jgi:hypothetical protein